MDQEVTAYIARNTDVPIEDVRDYLRTSGVAGTGLILFLRGNPGGNKLIGALLDLHLLAKLAAINRSNCSKLDALGQQVCLALEVAGKRGHKVDEEALQRMVTLASDINQQVDLYVKEGWLLHIACNESGREVLDVLHINLVQELRDAGLERIPDVRALPPSEYREVTKPLRRLLRQLGQGSLRAGVAALKPDSRALELVASLLEVEEGPLAAEAALVPASEVELDMLYKSLYGDAQLLQLGEQEADAAGEGPGGAGGEAPAMYGEAFKFYDKNESGAIELEELQAVLSDLGLLEGKSPADAQQAAAAHMRLVDKEGSGALDAEAFGRLYDTLVGASARHVLRFRMGPQTEEDMQSMFTTFASFGSREAANEMDGARFIKFCRDCSLLDNKFTSTEADLTFAKVKTKGARRLTFDQFLCALNLMADKKGTSFDSLINEVLSCRGPIAHATRADAVRLHDDKNCYTGVYARGGPTNVDPSLDLSAYLGREGSTPGGTGSKRGGMGGGKTPPSASRGSTLVMDAFRGSSRRQSTSSTPGVAASGTTSVASSRPASAVPSMARTLGAAAGTGDRQSLSGGGSAAAGAAAKGAASTAGASSLQAVFKSFATFGIHGTASKGGASAPLFHTTASSASTVGRQAGKVAVEMDGFRFQKLCREAGLLDASFTPTSADLLFTKIKDKGGKKIRYAQFCEALQQIASQKRVSYEELVAQVEGCQGPTLNAASADVVRQHDTGLTA